MRRLAKPLFLRITISTTPSKAKSWTRLGILWRGLKTHNVLIDNNGDAVVLDFVGGNTVGWVDNDKYATMEGEVRPRYSSGRAIPGRSISGPLCEFYSMRE
jgi:hypothetical protein